MDKLFIKSTSGEKSAYQAEQIEIPSLNWTYTCPWKLHLHYTFNKKKKFKYQSETDHFETTNSD